MASTEELDAAYARWRYCSTEERAALLARYRATTPFKRAWKIISPKAECAADCERRLAHALWFVRRMIDDEKSKQSVANRKKLIEKLAKTLRTAIDITNQLGRVNDPWVVATKGRLREIEHYWIRACARKGGPRKKHSRRYAVQRARWLLEKYGNRPPTRDRLGKWHELARVLFGNEEADLFDYIEDDHRARLRVPPPKKGRSPQKSILVSWRGETDHD